MKILNEQYLQQRIEELEQHKIELKERVSENYFNGCINELKQLLANCEEVEEKEIRINEYSCTFCQYAESEGYKLIKIKE